VFGAIFKPRPYPAFVLLAIICTIIGLKLMRASHIAGYSFIVVAIVFLISFIRGLMVDLSINRVGILTTARVTSIERKSGTFKGKTEAWWKVGDSGKVRYHPDFPEEHRWLE
jgi:hypothetical protein